MERRRFSVDDVLQMLDAGILASEEPVELVNLHGNRVVGFPRNE
ncbi:MAG: hypothetical protein AAFX94_06070 [Myxococcota bacterium]